MAALRSQRADRRITVIIDAHAHMGQGEPGSEDILQTGISPEMIVFAARDAGIDKTVVFQVTITDYRSGNREITDAVGKYPDDLIGFARVNPTTPDAEEILRQAKQDGLLGLKLHHGCDDFDLSDRRVGRIVALAGELGMPVIFHSMGAIADLENLARQHPQTNIIFGHFAGMWNWPDMYRCIQLAEELQNIYLETSANLLSRLIREAAMRVPDRVLFGSDAPAMHPGVELAKIKYCRLPQDVEERVLGGNVARLLQL
jgi:predicted TIM-barrel fold metal-dependent hydrolase